MVGILSMNILTIHKYICLEFSALLLGKDNIIIACKIVVVPLNVNFKVKVCNIPLFIFTMHKLNY